jgi:transposase InsO family protein
LRLPGGADHLADGPGAPVPAPQPALVSVPTCYDFVQARTRDGRVFQMLTVIDEFTRECLAIDVARRFRADDVLERLSDLFVRRGGCDLRMV